MTNAIEALREIAKIATGIAASPEVKNLQIAQIAREALATPTPRGDCGCPPGYKEATGCSSDQCPRGPRGELEDECTDCGGTGVTFQTERRCACQPAPTPELDGGDIVERLRSHMGTQDVSILLADCRVAADLIDQLAKREKELMEALETACSFSEKPHDWEGSYAEWLEDERSAVRAKAAHALGDLRRARRLSVPNSRAEE